MTKLTPLHIEILFHCYTNPAPHDNRSDTAQEYTRHLEVDGLIVRKTDTGAFYEFKEVPVYQCTPKGRAHIEQILALPYPTQAWISTSGEIIKI